MVLSMGWNPFYGNTKKSFETHIIHNFENDFYGSELIVVMLGYLRPEKNFDSLDSLKGKIFKGSKVLDVMFSEAIWQDVENAKRELDLEEHKPFLTHDIFTNPNNNSVNS